MSPRDHSADLTTRFLPPPPEPLELPQRRRSCRFLPRGSCQEVQLGDKDEVPEYQRRPFILAGYRLHTRGCFRCLKTAVAMHNETVNIWTHLLGLIPITLWAISMPTRMATVYEKIDGHEGMQWTSDWMSLAALYVCTLNCLFFSAFYHIRHCDAESIAYGCFYLDILGVVVLLVASEGVGIWLCFRCFPWARLAYGVLVFALLPTMVVSVMYGKLSDGTRAAVFAACGLFGLIPAAHWGLIASSDETTTFLPYVAGMLFCYGLGAAIYGTRFPESRWPGRFDFCGQSHNLWHLCVFAGMVVTLTAMERMVVLYAGRVSC